MIIQKRLQKKTKDKKENVVKDAMNAAKVRRRNDDLDYFIKRWNRRLVCVTLDVAETQHTSSNQAIGK